MDLENDMFPEKYMMELYGPSADSNFVNPPVPLVYDDSVSTSSIERVLFVNSAVVPLETYANPTTFPIVYNSSSSLEDILEVMRRKFSGLSRVGFAFHNHENLTRFCNLEKWFADSDLEDAQTVFSTNVQFMLDLLREFKVTHVDFLACKTLQSEKWRKYFHLIQTQTGGVIVGASDDDTGNMKYGGDWVLESTMEDVRDVYFTPAIESYVSLLASSALVTNLGNYNDSLTILGDYTYTFSETKIFRIHQRINTATDFYDPGSTLGTGFRIRALCASGAFLFFHSGSGSIGKLNILDGSVVDLNWISGLSQPWGIVTDGTFLYVTNYENAQIIGINFQPPSFILVVTDTCTGCSELQKITVPSSTSPNGCTYLQTNNDELYDKIKKDPIIIDDMLYVPINYIKIRL